MRLFLKVTAESKGRVTFDSTSLVAAEFQILDWSKIASDKLTKLSGYENTNSFMGNSSGIANFNTGSVNFRASQVHQ